MTPMPDWGFPGLRAGDKWCLCVLPWKEALGCGLRTTSIYGSDPDVRAGVCDSWKNLREHALPK